MSLEDDLNQEWRETYQYLQPGKSTVVTEEETIEYILHGFLEKIPYGPVWQEQERKGLLDQNNAEKDLFQRRRSELYKSKTARKFFEEIGETLQSAGVPAQLMETKSAKELQDRPTLLKQNYLREAYHAYQLLRQKGYNRFDLVSTV